MVRKRPRLWAGAVLASVGMVAAACGAPSGGAAAGAASTVTIALTPGSSLDWWPPLVPSTNCSDLVGGGGVNGPNMYLPMLWIGRQDNINYSRSIASGITVSHGDTQFTIHLNPKWHWSNGQPVTAADVVYDWQLIHAATQTNSPLPYCFLGEGGVPTDWSSVTAPNSHTVVVTTTKAVNPVWFEHNGLSQFVPLPKQQWDRYSNMTQELNWIKKVGVTPSNPVYQVVDGPYQIQKAVANSYWTFKANPHYDGAHQPSIKTVVYRYETSSSAEFAQLRTGTVNVGYLPFSLYKESQQLSSYHLVSESGFSFFYLPLNFRSNALGVGGLFNHLYIRQALQEGINQPAIIQALYHGLAVPTYGPVPLRPKNLYYDPKLTNTYSYNVAKATQLLTSHGWSMHNGVMTNASGQKLSFTFIYTTGSSTFANMAQLLKQDWAREGIQVQLDPVGSSDFNAIVPTPAGGAKWAMAGGFGWGYGPDYYPSGGGLFASSAGFNVGAYNSGTMNALIAKTYAGGSPAQVSQRFFAYEAYAATNLPVLYVPTPDSLTEVANQVHGYRSAYNPINNYSPINRWTLGS